MTGAEGDGKAGDSDAQESSSSSSNASPCSVNFLPFPAEVFFSSFSMRTPAKSQEGEKSLSRSSSSFFPSPSSPSSHMKEDGEEPIPGSLILITVVSPSSPSSVDFVFGALGLVVAV
ncbi:hypothetical protein CSUI_007666 [Cystoisospora suis]|uniref:Uncharacterized protein n=1 Tax=Cystoisospora suis TaxID=483139 RepID=A0A2C6KPV1_9APIC|nr:hypothetical protein CSUI_007666 [Cystoisospora suis]